MKHIAIVSHPLCPHAQRLVLASLAMGLSRSTDFEVVYLNLATLRDTVKAYSPTGDIPALLVDGKCRTTTTEHAAEYIASAGSLIPVNADERLMVRERERIARVALDKLRVVFTAQSQAVLDSALPEFFACMSALDANLVAHGSDTGVWRMDWVALAPIFSLVMFHRALREHSAWTEMPTAYGVGMRLSQHTLVQVSQCPNYAQEFNKFFSITGSAFPTVFHAN